MPPPARTHLPLRPDDAKTLPSNGTVFDENDPAEGIVHPELQRLPSLSLRGTFSGAYAILVKINTAIGWDALLKQRSNVFVMEDEYRIHRAIAEDDTPGEEEDDLEMDMENVDLEGEPPISRAKIQIDQLVSQAQGNQPVAISSKAPPVSLF